MTQDELAEIKKVFEERLISGRPSVAVNMTEHDWKLWFRTPKFIADLIEEVERCWNKKTDILNVNTMMWLVVKSAGGKVRVPHKDVREFIQGTKIITRYEDINGDVVYKAESEVK